MNRFGLVILSFLIVLGCKSPPEQKERVNLYFDVVDFFEKEATRLQGSSLFLEKRAVINGKSEIQNFDQIDWKEELAVFLEGDINKPAWQGRYDVDSSSLEGKTAAVTYNCNLSDLRLRQLKVLYNLSDNSVEKVEMLLRSENPLYKSGRIMIYQPDSGYTIEGNQDILFFDPDFFSIRGQFKKH